MSRVRFPVAFTMILLFCFVTPAAFAIDDEKSCRAQVFDQVVDGRPYYWAQRSLRPRDERLYLKPEEVARGTYFAAHDVGAIDYTLPGINGLDFTGQDTPHGNPESHASSTLSLMAMVGLRDNRPTGKHFAFNGTNNFVTTLKAILEYNRTAPPEKKIHVLNASLKSEEFSAQNPLHTEIEALMKEVESRNELTLVLSAGNEHNEVRPGTLAAAKWPSIVIVTATSESRYALTPYSSTDPSLTMAAPGGNEESVITSFGTGFGGTSAAAPFVSGAMLAMYRVAPTMDALTARAILKATAISPYGSQHDRQLGFGLPNIPLATAIAREVLASPLKGKTESERILEVRERITQRLRRSNAPESRERLASDRAHGEPTSGHAVQPFGDFPVLEKLTYDYVRSASDCNEYAARFDRLLNAYYLSHGAAEMATEMCRFYLAQEVSWGIKNYCPIEKVVEHFGKDSLWRDEDFFRQLAIQGEKLFGETEHRRLIEKAIETNPDIAIRDILLETSLARRYPAEYDRWMRVLLGRGGSTRKRVVDRAFSQPSIRQLPGWRSWVKFAFQGGIEGNGWDQFDLITRFYSRPEYRDIAGEDRQRSLEKYIQTTSLDDYKLSDLLSLLKENNESNQKLKRQLWDRVLSSDPTKVNAELLTYPEFIREFPTRWRALMEKFMASNPYDAPSVLRSKAVFDLDPELWEKYFDRALQYHLDPFFAGLAETPWIWKSSKFPKWLEKAAKKKGEMGNLGQFLANPEVDAYFSKQQWADWLERMSKEKPGLARSGWLLDRLAEPAMQKKYSANWETWVERAFQAYPERASEAFLADAQIRRDHPELWEKWFQRVLLDSRNDATMLEYVLGKDALVADPRWTQWLDPIANRSPVATSRYILGSKRFYQAFPQKWKQWRDLCLEKAPKEFAQNVLGEAWYLRENPAQWLQELEKVRSKLSKEEGDRLVLDFISERQQISEAFPRQVEKWLTEVSGHPPGWALGNEYVMQHYPSTWEKWVDAAIEQKDADVLNYALNKRAARFHPAYDRLVAKAMATFSDEQISSSDLALYGKLAVKGRR